jgi:WhiB family redox-sensing transcriptional regulator
MSEMAEIILDNDIPWQQWANCRSVPPDLMFPDSGKGVEAAKQVCEGCAVKGVCGEYAIVNHIQHGVWGGMSERQRRIERRKRKYELGGGR